MWPERVRWGPAGGQHLPRWQEAQRIEPPASGSQSPPTSVCLTEADKHVSQAGLRAVLLWLMGAWETPPGGLSEERGEVMPATSRSDPEETVASTWFVSAHGPDEARPPPGHPGACAHDGSPGDYVKLSSSADHKGEKRSLP